MTGIVHGLFWGIIIASVLMTIAAVSIWFERKFAGRLQSRVGVGLTAEASADAAVVWQVFRCAGGRGRNWITGRS